MVATPAEEPKETPEVILAQTSSGSSKAVKALKMAIFGLVFSAAGFAAGLGVNVRDTVKGYIGEVDSNNPVGIMAAIRILADIDTQCRESKERTAKVLQILEKQYEK